MKKTFKFFLTVLAIFVLITTVNPRKASAASCTIRWDPYSGFTSTTFTVSINCNELGPYLVHVGPNEYASGNTATISVSGLPVGIHLFYVTKDGVVSSPTESINVSSFSGPPIPPPSSGGGIDPADETLPITGGQPGQIKNPIISKIIGQMGDSTGGTAILQLLLRNGIILALGIAGLIFVFILIRGGYGFLTAGADKDAHQKSAKLLTNGIVGLALVLSLFAIIYLLNLVLGINIYNLTIGSIA